ncbi:hypothetical protein, partial [Nocardia abscessus]|uniref:hypothetical protein n=1 Tax=Nocardia abscessus TaxID=120957 RepID=UPI001C3F1505
MSPRTGAIPREEAHGRGRVRPKYPLLTQRPAHGHIVSAAGDLPTQYVIRVRIEQAGPRDGAERHRLPMLPARACSLASQVMSLRRMTRSPFAAHCSTLAQAASR